MPAASLKCGKALYFSHYHIYTTLCALWYRLKDNYNFPHFKMCTQETTNTFIRRKNFKKNRKLWKIYIIPLSQSSSGSAWQIANSRLIALWSLTVIDLHSGFLSPHPPVQKPIHESRAMTHARKQTAPCPDLDMAPHAPESRRSAYVRIYSVTVLRVTIKCQAPKSPLILLKLSHRTHLSFTHIVSL